MDPTSSLTATARTLAAGSRATLAKRLVMTQARIEIRAAENRVHTIVKELAFAKAEGNLVVLASPLAPSQPLNEHLVWIWGALKLRRKYLKGLQADGAQLVCVCRCPKGAVVVKPNGSEMLHLLGMDLEIQTQ